MKDCSSYSAFLSTAFAALVVAGGLAFATPAHAQRRAELQQQLNAYLLLGFGGDASYDPGEDVDLDPSVGLGLRYQAPLNANFAIGGLFEIRSFELDPDTNRQPVFDFDVFFKTGWIVAVGRSDFEVYGLAPFGLSIASEDEVFTGTNDTGIGFNLGLLAGGQWIIRERIGVFVEAGWRRHQIFSEEGGGDFDVATNQFAMNLGASYAL
ncbi:MAG: outer membrane beta-barrel protein [Myxococcota bacterium]